MDNRAIWRGKRIDTGDWVQGYFAEDERDNYQALIICSISVDIDERNSDILSHEIHVVDPATLGQCTGLKDKHEKSIYEGDIINVCCYSYTECEDEAFGQIIDSRFGYALLSEENIIYLNDIQGSYKTIYTVCGNIHDNPSLLKGGRQE